MIHFFESVYLSKKSKARRGVIHTSHGDIMTPAFVPVATKGTIKALHPQFLKDINIQAAFVNTYHLVSHPGVDIIASAGGIHKYAKLPIPLMSDSGGFQVFSLAREKIRHFQADIRGEEQPMVVKISDDGVKFRSSYDGQLIDFTPEKSIEYQTKIGADIMIAFDECTYYPATHKYAEKAMERTHDWLKRCIEYKKSNFQNPVFNLPCRQAGQEPISKFSMRNCKNDNLLKINQYLYGVIQGAAFEDLRKKSAEFVTSQGVDGIAIGGVSVGESKHEMRDQVRWVSEYLPKNKPVHLLGVGQIDDIVDLVKYGIDTFDCVEPTRLARMGKIYQISNIKNQKYISKIKYSETDILKTIYKRNLEPPNKDCGCYVCRHFTKSYLHHLFKQKEILGYNLATYHNLWVMERLMEKIRGMIEEDKL